MSDYPLGLRGRKFPYHVNTTADHWWPKGVQRLWADPHGYISRINPQGYVDKRKPPKKGGKKGFAQKRGGHKITLGVSPWNDSFEPEFDNVDNRGPVILKQIQQTCQTRKHDPANPLLEEDTVNQLIKFCLSLMVRSPSFQDRYSQAGRSFGISYNEEAGKANMRHFWGFLKDVDLANCNRSQVSILHSNEAEFIFGDGVFDTILNHPVTWRPLGHRYVMNLTGTALIPLLPDICIYLQFTRDGSGNTTYKKSAPSEIVNMVNALTQIYSKEQLFFRTKRPELTQEYRRGEHLRASPEHLTLIANTLH